MALFAFGFVALDTGEMGGVVGDVHRSAASRLRTGEMFVLEGLDKPTMSLVLLFRFHSVLIPPYSSQRVA